MNRRALVPAALVLLAGAAGAHSEFQAFVRQHSGRPVDCALCHVNPTGPQGNGPGQIDSLSPAEQAQLQRARAAFDPTPGMKSPILNEFGDLLLERLGKKRILELRSAPERIAEELGYESDLDHDGVPDAREFLDGTHPLRADDGDPWTLFWHNLRRQGFHVVMITVATAITLYGLSNLLHGFAARIRAHERAGTTPGAGDEHP